MKKEGWIFHIKNFDGRYEEVEYLSRDQNYQDEQTTYWFQVGNEFFGVVESTQDFCIVDDENHPINTEDAGNVHLTKLTEFVTDELRQDF
jgi:hypothetical protein